MGKLEKRSGPSLPDIWKVYESRSKHINIREMCAEILARGGGKVHTIETEPKMYKKDTGSRKNLIIIIFIYSLKSAYIYWFKQEI